tara:strand:- start:97 stop:318 length:222 start_codon:yes stop_codon:yes gene_type:complete
MIDDVLIDSRKTILTTELENLQERVAQLDNERNTLIANINAIRGALQQCDYFLRQLSESEEVEEETEEEKEDG